MGLMLAALTTLSLPATSDAGCGCDKPPPPRAAIRPFVGWADQQIVLFNDALQEGKKYDVRFESTVGGGADWSRGRAKRKRDIADGQQRMQLRVEVPNLPLGPTRVTVYRDNGQVVMQLADSAFTIAAEPIALHDFRATTNRTRYQAAIGRDGTIYIPVDVSQVDDGTRFWGTAVDLPLVFQASNVAMYNDQGYLMQLLDSSIPNLFDIYSGDQSFSNTLAYWRHEFRTYKQQHRWEDAFDVDDDPEWHTSGTRHVNHDTIVVAIRGTLENGGTLSPGSTQPFQLVVMSEPEEH
ncbi:MAG TPA: hypothetical protein VGR62_08630 [Candidatus Binatia bacterium]|jgi:hypothetical protein|nr:hypothetical protein [Candidatus Binatia bacterium]